MTMDSPAGSSQSRPLYAQLRDALLARLIDGRWGPGMLLPSEKQLAAEFGLSQGTVRKVLNELAAEHLVVRHQGRGTYVAEPEEGRILFTFFKLTGDDGKRRLPHSAMMHFAKIRADQTARANLALPSASRVWAIDRVRQLDDSPVICERIILPVARFPDLHRISPIPNNVYQLYSARYGVTIARAVERLKAVAAEPADCAALGCAPATPLLLIDRVAFGLDGSPLEWRVSRCLTNDVHYLSELR